MEAPNQHQEIGEVIEILNENGYAVTHFNVDVDFSKPGFMVEDMHIVKKD